MGAFLSVSYAGSDAGMSNDPHIVLGVAEEFSHCYGCRAANFIQPVAPVLSVAEVTDVSRDTAIEVIPAAMIYQVAISRSRLGSHYSRVNHSLFLCPDCLNELRKVLGVLTLSTGPEGNAFQRGYEAGRESVIGGEVRGLDGHGPGYD